MTLFAKMTVAATALGACSCATPKPQFSTFSDHYLSVMQQDGCTLLEAAKWVHSIGIDGVDARTTLTDEQMADFKAAGIKPACAILDLSYSRQSPEEMLQMEDQAIEFCKKHGFDKLMYCPVLMFGDASESVRDSLRQSVSRFAAKVVAAGIQIAFEDYDNPRSLTYNMQELDKLFALVPDAMHTYDSGNYIYAGDDPMEAFDKYRKKIIHVHLKDRLAVGDSASPVVGTGIAPCREVVKILLSEGYKGWFTIEGYGARDMKYQLSESVRNLMQE